MITALFFQPVIPSIGQSCSVMSNYVLLSARSISTTNPLAIKCAGKYKKTSDRSLRLTYQMARKPTHIGVSKGCMTFHSQNLEGFRQQQPVTIAQDEVIIRLMRGIFYKQLTARGTEFVIKRRGNVLYVAGFLQHGRRIGTRKLYWLIGFTEELLTNLLKQPVKLEIQFVESEDVLTYTMI